MGWTAGRTRHGIAAAVDKVSPDGHLAPDNELGSAFVALEELGGGTPGTG